MGVVVRRYIDILTIIIIFPTPLVLALFFGNSIPTSMFIFKMFFSFFIYIPTYMYRVHITIYQLLET